MPLGKGLVGLFGLVRLVGLFRLFGLLLFFHFVEDFARVTGSHVELWCLGVDDVEDNVGEGAVGVGSAVEEDTAVNVDEHVALGLSHSIVDRVAAEHGRDYCGGAFFGNPVSAAWGVDHKGEVVGDVEEGFCVEDLAECGKEFLIALGGEVGDTSSVFHGGRGVEGEYT